MRTGRRALFVGAGAILAFALSACGASSSAPLTVEQIALPAQPAESVKVGKTFFIPGEVMAFDISLRGVVGGTATIGVGEPGFVDDHNVVIVRSHVESAGMLAVIKEVRDEVTTWVDLDAGTVFKLEADSRFGAKHAVINSDLGAGSPGAFTIDYKRDKGHLVRVRQMVPEGQFAFDLHAMLGLIRAWDADDGDDASFFLLSGRRLWRSSIRVGAHETIRTAMGKHAAIRIDGVGRRVTRGLKDDPKRGPRHYSVWLSDDADRLPLLVMANTEYGALRVELTEYSRPDRRLTTR